MTINRSWASYPATYRAREIKTLAGWIASGESGSVVGLPGSGRANLLGFLCHRPEALQAYLPNRAKAVALIPIDLNSLPANNLSTLYRVMLRAFYRTLDKFNPALQQKVADIYRESSAQQDPFLNQSALQEIFLHFQAQRYQVVIVLNRFDRFCDMATPQMVNTLRGLRDDFKDTLCYMAGLAQEVAYLPDRTALGHMYELLDNYVCWVGAMHEDDARNLITRATYAAPASPSGADIAAMLALTGGYPILLRAVCHWWLTTEEKLRHTEWITRLQAERSIQHRLAKIWHGLTQEEQFVLSELQKHHLTGADVNPMDGELAVFSQPYQRFVKTYRETLDRLAQKGVCRHLKTGWRIEGELLAAYIATVEGRGRGKIWLDAKTDEIYQGETPLTGLTALEQSVLAYLIMHPRLKHPKTDLIINTWPDELRQQGVSDNSLYQVMLTLRKAIEPNPGRPAYLITWRGKPEGGYQFFPEGRPG